MHARTRVVVNKCDIFPLPINWTYILDRFENKINIKIPLKYPISINKYHYDYSIVKIVIVVLIYTSNEYWLTYGLLSA